MGKGSQEHAGRVARKDTANVSAQKEQGKAEARAKEILGKTGLALGGSAQKEQVKVKEEKDPEPFKETAINAANGVTRQVIADPESGKKEGN